MVTGTVLASPPAKAPFVERMVKAIEEVSPALPLVACLIWGVGLILLSFPLHLAVFPVGTKSFGWIPELNWSSTFGFFIPFSLFFSCLTMGAIPQVITSLSEGQMIRDGDGQLADTDALIASWRKRAGAMAWVALVVGLAGFISSWAMAWIYCFHPAQVGTSSWQRAVLLNAPDVTPWKVDVLGFLAYSSQGAAIACFCYYILMIFTFANWIYDYTRFGKRPALYPDIAGTDPRYGFERFGPVIEGVLLASLAYFFQFFMTRLFYIYADDPTTPSIFDVISRALGSNFGSDVKALVGGAGVSVFEDTSKTHFQNTIMGFAMLTVVISAIIVPTVMVRNAADRSRTRLQEALRKSPDLATRWYGLSAAEALGRLDKMTVWPIRYARPSELLLLILLATVCFFYYKLFFFLAALIIYQAVRFFTGRLKG